jgi:uncharacterized membrane protein (DUF4010 family)
MPSPREWVNEIVSLILAAFAGWLLYTDIQPDHEIKVTTAVVALVIGLFAGVLFDPAKVREAVALYREAKKP